MVEWTTAGSIAVRAGSTAYSYRHSIHKFFTKAKAYVDMGKAQILITGHAGAGKTLLASQMHGRARELGFQIPSESKDVEVDAITPGMWSKLVRVLPGQEGYRSKGAVENLQDNDALEGIIHVVDFGFTCPRDPAVVHAMINNDKILGINQLRSLNLQSEIDSLRGILTDARRLYERHHTPKWILIAVNKIDLFPNDKNNALLHYHPLGNSQFSKALAEFQKDIGNNNIRIHIAPVCAYEHDFNWNSQTVGSSLARQEQNKILVDFMKIVADFSEAYS